MPDQDLVYTGPHAAVIVPIPGTLRVIRADRNTPVRVPEAAAESLLAQGTWERVPPKLARRRRSTETQAPTPAETATDEGTA